MAASDAARLKSARGDMKEILKTTYCHSILAAARRRAHGPNELLDHPGHSVLQLVAQQFEDTLVRIPLAAGGVSFALALSSLAGATRHGCRHLEVPKTVTQPGAPHPCVRVSMVEAPDREELDKEFDTIPSAKRRHPPDRPAPRCIATTRRPAVAFTDDHYPVRSAFSLLGKVLEDYLKSFGESWRTAKDDATQHWQYLDDALTKYQLLSHCKQFNNVISETTLPSLTGKVHGGRLNFRVFHWIAPLLPATLFGIGTVSSSPSSAPCLLSPVALMILVAFEPRLWCGSMAIVPWLSG
ncbi:hypothetical protein ZWY2020_041458 [Hordeum vulgare]|nr:hypothetical protein ZWY2020_041458 [Hordeum vulgare]